jgi:hypothetical protein
MLIAAPAWAVDAFCVTGNVAEFKRVPALRTLARLIGSGASFSDF